MSALLLRAGPVTATFEDGGLRWLRLGEHELVRGIYVAVRDDAWRTIPGRLRDLQVDDRGHAFDVTFTSDHREGAVAFVWRGRIAGRANGSVSFVMDGRAEATFPRNRIGFCLLHPMEVAGSPVTIITPDGPVTGEFPGHISPDQPFKEIVGIRWPVGAGLEADIRFEGEIFEMEDQRNWTDASFKTYCTPLRLPFPVLLEKGTVVSQAVYLSLLSDTSEMPEQIVGGPREPLPSGRVEGNAEDVEVGESMGPLPPLGVALAQGREHLSTGEAERLRGLRPGFLQVTVDLRRPDWSTTVTAASEAARSTGTRLRIEVIAGDVGEGLGPLLDLIASTRVPVTSIAGFPTTGFSTTRPLAQALRALAQQFGVVATIVGGSRANFAELNRAELPVDLLDAITYPITPQVHAFDNASIIETIPTQGLTVREARRIGNGLPVYVGPVTLRPRFNAYGAPRPDGGLDNAALRADPRQGSWFAAAWMLASIAALARNGAASIAYFEATGPAGVIASPIADEAQPMSPVELTLRAIAELAGASVCEVTAPPEFAVLGLASGGGCSVFVAHHDDRPRTIAIAHMAGRGPVVARAIGSTDAPVVVEATKRSGAAITVEPRSLVRVDLGGPHRRPAAMIDVERGMGRMQD